MFAYCRPDLKEKKQNKKIGIMPNKILEEMCENIEMAKEELLEDENSWIQTYTGERANVFNFKEEDVNIIDIAHSLSLQCRFNGHVKRFYSVAQHSLMVAYIIEQFTDNPREILQGLLHDAGEAYIGDLPKPIKSNGRFKVFKEIEDNLMKAICKKFNIDFKFTKGLEDIDIFCCLYEGKNLMPYIEDWELYKKYYIPIYMAYINYFSSAQREVLKKFIKDEFNPRKWEAMFLQKFYKLKAEIERG